MVGLKEYLDTREPFDWGYNNCLKFVSEGLEVQGIEALPSDWFSGFHDERSALRHYIKMKKKYPPEDIIEALDERFSRELTLHPQDGMIVARETGNVLGYAFGLTYGSQCYFMSDQGAVATPIQPTDYYWRVK